MRTEHRQHAKGPGRVGFARCGEPSPQYQHSQVPVPLNSRQGKPGNRRLGLVQSSKASYIRPVVLNYYLFDRRLSEVQSQITHPKAGPSRQTPGQGHVRPVFGGLFSKPKGAPRPALVYPELPYLVELSNSNYLVPNGKFGQNSASFHKRNSAQKAPS